MRSARRNPPATSASALAALAGASARALYVLRRLDPYAASTPSQPTPSIQEVWADLSKAGAFLQAAADGHHATPRQRRALSIASFGLLHQERGAAPSLGALDSVEVLRALRRFQESIAGAFFCAPRLGRRLLEDVLGRPSMELAAEASEPWALESVGADFGRIARRVSDAECAVFGNEVGPSSAHERLESLSCVRAALLLD